MASQQAYCRDCLSPLSPDARRCNACGSPRLLKHPELGELTIAHVDCDAFYASVEKRDRPELANLPVIIGGGRRGVVSTACYVARIAGVRSAMPMFKALDLCPNAVVIKPDMQKYVQAGREIRAMMLELTPLVEPISIDEAFLDLGGTQKLHKAPAAEILLRFAERVEREMRVTISVGLSYCKFLAKIASDMNKPRGFSVLGRAEATEFLAKQPVSLIWGVGRAMQEKLAGDGLTTIGQLQQMDEIDLTRRYGVIGQRLSRLSRGLDTRKVDPDGEMKSVSAETTFNNDIMRIDELTPILRRLAEKVSARLKSKHIAGTQITLKLKTKDFKTRTRNRSLADPTQLADRIFNTAHDMLTHETGREHFRLIGVGVSGLTDDGNADPHDLVDVKSGKRAQAERAMDAVREKYGTKSVELGMTFSTQKR